MKFGWRWRRNPLRRRSDVIEAWLGLLTALLLCALPALGWWAGHSVDRSLQHLVRTQHAERTLVTATVQPAGKAPESGSGITAGRPGHSDVLRWKGPDGSTHTATVASDMQVTHSGKVQLWTDRTGALAPPPLDSATVVTHSVLAGVVAAAGVAGLLLIARKALLWRLMLRRMASWEREWARVGQNWGRTGAGG